MSRVLLPVGLIGALLALAGCSTTSKEASVDQAVKPVAATRHGATQASAHYALGRYYQGQVRYDQAIASYQAVLEARPDYVEAHNALGVIYATQGRHDLAEQELRAALALAPGAAHIHNNLGYALLLQGRPADAAAVFAEALRLEPGHPRASQNLQLAQARLAGRAAEPPFIATPVRAAEKMEAMPLEKSSGLDTAPSVRLKAVAANVYELQLPAPRVPAVAAAPQAAPVQPAIPAPAQPVRLEVANGNGVEGLARQTSAYLKAVGYGSTRLTNQKPYVQQVTEIQYRPGFESQALGLQAALAGKGVTTVASQLRPDVEVRVVLGRDLRTTAQLAEITARPVRLAAAD